MAPDPISAFLNADPLYLFCIIPFCGAVIVYTVVGLVTTAHGKPTERHSYDEWGIRRRR